MTINAEHIVLKLEHANHVTTEQRCHLIIVDFYELRGKIFLHFVSYRRAIKYIIQLKPRQKNVGEM